jgi:hypothetical protein
MDAFLRRLANSYLYRGNSVEFWPTVVLLVDTANFYQTDAFLMEIYARMCESLHFPQARRYNRLFKE